MKVSAGDTVTSLSVIATSAENVSGISAPTGTPAMLSRLLDITASSAKAGTTVNAISTDNKIANNFFM